MANHPNRNWRSRWTVDVGSATASHRDGWAFRFSPVNGEAGVFDGECVAQPEPLTQEHLAQAPRIAKEAGDIYVEALQPDTKSDQAKRPVGRPAVVSGKRVQVYLDHESLVAAAKLGDGNVSEGIRKALRNAAEK